MNKETRKKVGRTVLAALACLIMGGAVTFAVQWITLGDGSGALVWCLSRPRVTLLTAVLYGLPVFFIGSLTGWFFLGGLLTAAPALILALVNYFKTRINGTPLEIEDFSMAGQLDQVAGVAGDLSLPVTAKWCIAGLAICVAILFLLRKWLRLPGGRVRFLAVTLAAAMLAGVAFGPEATVLGDLFGVDMDARIASRIAYRDYGLSLGLWRDKFLRAGTPPEDYGPEKMRADLELLDVLLADYREQTPCENPPNVIVVQSESFFDMTRLPGLTLERDPVENFHRLQKEGLSGRFYSTYLGYGTGYIEVSILSGVTGKDFRPGTNLCFRDIEDYSLLDSVVTPFQRYGYQTEALHGYNDSLYNRVNTFPRMGFDKLLFSADIQALDLPFTGSAYAGGYYLSDHVFTLGLLDQFQKITAAGDRAFLYGITMENHQPFDAEKFGWACQIKMDSDVLSEENLWIARVMLEGITRADQALGELADALRQSDELTIVVFFGDHLPNLFMTDGGTVYSHLGLCEGNDCADWTIDQVADLYSTDYLIWANDPALLNGLAGIQENTSVTAVGTRLLKLAGMPLTRYWALQDRLSRALLVNTDLYCVDGAGRPHWNTREAALTEEERTLLRLREELLYDAYYGERYVTAQLNEAVGS